LEGINKNRTADCNGVLNRLLIKNFYPYSESFIRICDSLKTDASLGFDCVLPQNLDLVGRCMSVHGDGTEMPQNCETDKKMFQKSVLLVSKIDLLN